MSREIKPAKKHIIISDYFAIAIMYVSMQFAIDSRPRDASTCLYSEFLIVRRRRLDLFRIFRCLGMNDETSSSAHRKLTEE